MSMSVLVCYWPSSINNKSLVHLVLLMIRGKKQIMSDDGSKKTSGETLGSHFHTATVRTFGSANPFVDPTILEILFRGKLNLKPIHATTLQNAQLPLIHESVVISATRY